MGKPSKKAKNKWDKAHTSFVGLKLNQNTDADIIGILEACGNKQGYIKSLIRADISKAATPPE
jgi:hypothetical protein